MEKRITKKALANKQRRKKKKNRIRQSEENTAKGFFFNILPKKSRILPKKQQLAAVGLSFLSAGLFLFYPQLSITEPTIVYEEINFKIPADHISKQAEKPKKKILSETDKKILSIIKGTPMERMGEDILKKNKTVAAFLVGIALKESQYGKYSPKKNGKDCFNYWGYRGKEKPTQSGYSCFDSPSHAISVVGGRIDSLVRQGAKTPSAMVVWKCGYTCKAFPDNEVQGWIDDVGINYYKISQTKEIAKSR